MEVIRRNTDYAFRLMSAIAAGGENETLAVTKLVELVYVPQQLACKLLQKLVCAGLLESKMGPKGGYRLAKKSEQISFKDIVEAIQGPVSINLCLSNEFFCPLKDKCPISGHLLELQKEMERHLAEKTLAMLAK